MQFLKKSLKIKKEKGKKKKKKKEWLSMKTLIEANEMCNELGKLKWEFCTSKAHWK